MRFLVDRCAGNRLATWLQEQGHDAMYAAAVGPDPGDLALLLMAVAENRVLITIDSDFGRLVYMDGEEHCGIVRLPDVRCARRIELMKIILERYAPKLIENAVITVRGDLIRISTRKVI